jgi:hypothetical protein
MIHLRKHFFNGFLDISKIDSDTDLIQLAAFDVDLYDPVVSVNASAVSRIATKTMSGGKMGLDIDFENTGHS